MGLQIELRAQQRPTSMTLIFKKSNHSSSQNAQQATLKGNQILTNSTSCTLSRSQNFKSLNH